MVYEILCRCDRPLIEGSDASRERVDKSVELGFGKRTVDVPISLCGIAVEVVSAENDL